MTLRILLFIMVVFVFFALGLRALQIPLDGVLAFLAVLIPLVVLVFAHYRRIGRLRTLGLTQKALWHLRFWRLLLPKEAYLQLRLSILVEGEAASASTEQALEAAEGILAPAFLFGFRAELARRRGDLVRAEAQLRQGLVETPPGLLRAGLIAQLARLLLKHQPNKRQLKEVGSLLDEASGYVSEPAHRHLLSAVRGELQLARGEYEQAATSLESCLNALMTSTVAPPATMGAWDRMWFGLRLTIARFTYSQQDEHQFPFYAELYGSLSEAQRKAGRRDEAIAALRKGLSLCQQPFVAEPLQRALDDLGAA